MISDEHLARNSLGHSSRSHNFLDRGFQPPFLAIALVATLSPAFSVTGFLNHPLSRSSLSQSSALLAITLSPITSLATTLSLPSLSGLWFYPMQLQFRTVGCSVDRTVHKHNKNFLSRISLGPSHQTFLVKSFPRFPEIPRPFKGVAWDSPVEILRCRGTNKMRKA